VHPSAARADTCALFKNCSSVCNTCCNRTPPQDSSPRLLADPSCALTASGCPSHPRSPAKQVRTSHCDDAVRTSWPQPRNPTRSRRCRQRQRVIALPTYKYMDLGTAAVPAQRACLAPAGAHSAPASHKGWAPVPHAPARAQAGAWHARGAAGGRGGGARGRRAAARARHAWRPPRSAGSAASTDCMLCSPALGRASPRLDPRERSTRP